MRPLDGFTIIDLSQIVSGPMATMMLGEQGADVVKVEPLDGELLRVGDPNGLGMTYNNFNRAKRSVSVDLSTDDGREIVLGLCRTADVFVENFRPGVLAKLGLSADDVRAVNDDIITVSITGFGPDGPYAERTALDPVIQAYLGMIDGQVSEALPLPDLIRTLVADKASAYTAAQAITAALLARERGAGGQHLEIPMLDATMAWWWPDGMSDHTGAEGQPGPRVCDRYTLTPTADGQVTFYAAKIGHVVGLLRAVGRNDMADDPKYNTLGVYVEHPERAIEVWEIIAESVAQLSTDDAVAFISAEQVPVGPVLRRDQVVDDPQVQHNETLVEWDHPVAGRLRQSRPPVRFGATPTDLVPLVAGIGEHTDEVLRAAGHGDDAIAALRNRGVIGPPPS